MFPQRLIQPGVVEQNVLHTVLNSRRIQRLGAYGVVGIQCSYNSVRQVRFHSSIYLRGELLV